MMVLALAWVFAAPTAPAAHADDDHSTWRIPSYVVDATVDTSGTANVTLDLDFDFAADAGRGPYLWFPLRQRVAGNDDVWRVLDVTVTSVTSSTGASTEVAQDTEDGNLVVRIGSENRKDRLGVQHYTITYTIRGLVEPGAASGLDEFNWNVVGLGWEVPMDAVTLTLSGPGTVERVACFSGASFDQPCQAAASASGATFSAGPLRTGEGVQAVAGFPAGTFTGAEPTYVKRYHPGNLFPLTPVSGGLTATLLGLGVAGALLASRRLGRDETYVGLTPGLAPSAGEGTVGRAAKSEVAVQFTPPRGVTPGEVGTLIDASADNDDVTATLVDLAVRGHLTITEETDDGDTLWRFSRQSSRDGVTAPEAHLLGQLFREGSEVTSHDLCDDSYAPMVTGTQEALYARVTDELRWFPERPMAGRIRAVLVGATIVVVGIAAGIALAVTLGLGLVGFAIVAVGVLVIVMGAMNMFGRRTAAGSAVLAQARGFELYLTTAEADQIKFEESVDVFSRYLPYAIVFGVADRWARIFQQLAAEGRYQPDTSWYIGPGFGYSPAFASSIGSLASDLSASMTQSSAPSGGSGGSGFSGGGGFGGGGGGGW